MQINTDKYFLHTSVFLRHASGASGEGEQQIETILAKAVVAKSRVWISSILFAELRPSVFIPGRFATLFELTRFPLTRNVRDARPKHHAARGKASRRKVAKVPRRRPSR
jgi:hypothetical protein